MATVNDWMYYSSVVREHPSTDALEKRATATLASSPWRDEVRRWSQDERPATVAANLALQAVDVATFDDEELVRHLERAIDHFQDVAPLHFEHMGFDVAAGLLFVAAEEWEIDALSVVGLLAGASPASSEVDRFVERMARALEEAGAPEPSTFADVQRASPEAAAALEQYLDAYRWRVIAGHDLAEPAVGERPELLLTALRARRARLGARKEPSPDPAPVRGAVPAQDRQRFDQLLADARASYALRDDDVGVCFNWPLGLVRRAVLAAGQRLVKEGRLGDPALLFEAEPAEITALLRGMGPAGDELVERRARRAEAARVTPPTHLGEADQSETVAAKAPLPPAVDRLTKIRMAAWAVSPARLRGALAGIGVGTGMATGPARVISEPAELALLEPGEVLVAITTTTAFNIVFPTLAAVVTQEGGLFSHTAILARELSLPAVVGVDRICELVRNGDVIEVDAQEGVVRVLTGG